MKIKSEKKHAAASGNCPEEDIITISTTAASSNYNYTDVPGPGRALYLLQLF
jgi:hypothetical protein